MPNETTYSLCDDRSPSMIQQRYRRGPLCSVALPCRSNPTPCAVFCPEQVGIKHFEWNEVREYQATMAPSEGGGGGT